MISYDILIYTTGVSTRFGWKNWWIPPAFSQADTSGEGRMSFTEFLGLARDLEDGVRKEKSRKEIQLLGEVLHDTKMIQRWC